MYVGFFWNYLCILGYACILEMLGIINWEYGDTIWTTLKRVKGCEKLTELRVANAKPEQNCPLVGSITTTELI